MFLKKSKKKKALKHAWLYGFGFFLWLWGGGAQAAPKPFIQEDPGLDRALRKQLKKPQPTTSERLARNMWRYGSRLNLAYRWGKFACATSSCPYHQFSLVIYPMAMAAPKGPFWRMVRLGVGLEAGGETTQSREKWWQRNQTIAGVLSLGLQYPYRVTPFVDFIVTLGAIHRNIYNKDLFHFAHSVGIEAGVTVFAASWFGVTASLGWRRWVIKVDPKDLYYDTLTFSTGIGF